MLVRGQLCNIAHNSMRASFQLAYLIKGYAAKIESDCPIAKVTLYNKPLPIKETLTDICTKCCKLLYTCSLIRTCRRFWGCV